MAMTPKVVPISHGHDGTGEEDTSDLNRWQSRWSRWTEAWDRLVQGLLLIAVFYGVVVGLGGFFFVVPCLFVTGVIYLLGKIVGVW